MTFKRLSKRQLDKAMKRMQSPEYRKLVEIERQKWHEGQPINFEAIAKSIGLPLPLVLAAFQYSVRKQSGEFFIPTGEAQLN